MAAYTTIDDPSAYFKVQLYTGTGSGGSNRQITFDDTDTDMQPDLVWIKNRDSAQEHVLVDSVRGATKDLDPSENTAESTTSTRVGSFLSDGFQLGSGSLQNRVNGSSHKMVAWCWKESADAGFDIVSYTGNETARTISHSLSAVPKVIMPKARSSSGFEWRLYHAGNTSAPETDYLILNSTAATADASNAWNDTAPTSSVFSLGTGETPNDDGTTYIAYLWAEKQGFSKFGSYIGNGNANGTYIHLGFRPAFLMVKNIAATASWQILDNKRKTANFAAGTYQLRANDTTVETSAGSYEIDLLSNGFKIRTEDSSNWNTSGQSQIYMAFAEAPFVNSNGVPCNAR
tara:strand:+ start:823 stop:1857 length:1035 start_codon:yes stop_codon:yes gene_type:complete